MTALGCAYSATQGCGSGKQTYGTEAGMKFTQYFLTMRERPDRVMIRQEWIQRVISRPVREIVQKDGRIRRWAPIEEKIGRAHV